jgi:predicted RNA binding protein YcfA (HicA-like mRNA interferase family)
MKYSELEKLLRKNGCKILRNGTRHDIWVNTKTGKRFTMPRHHGQEVAEGTKNSILKSAGLK